jgi:hypothetical protein
MLVHKEYEELRRLLDIADAPSKGGNISIKEREYIYIKKSGEDLKKSSKIVRINIDEYKKNGCDNNASMELAFHIKLKKYVLHYHPFYINHILCSKECDKILKNGCPLKNFDIVEYYEPGEELAKHISYDMSSIIFLKNHGVIIHSDSIDEVCSLYYKLRKMFFDITYDTFYLTPDQFVLKDDLEILYHSILTRYLQDIIGLEPKYLSPTHIEKLSNNKKEKMRQK